MAEPVSPRASPLPAEPLTCLNPELVMRIDDAMCRVGRYGEVRLVIIRGVLRFIQVTVSEIVTESDKEAGPS